MDGYEKRIIQTIQYYKNDMDIYSELLENYGYMIEGLILAGKTGEHINALYNAYCKNSPPQTDIFSYSDLMEYIIINSPL